MRLPYILKAKHSVFYIRMLRFFRTFFHTSLTLIRDDIRESGMRREELVFKLSYLVSVSEMLVLLYTTKPGM